MADHANLILTQCQITLLPTIRNQAGVNVANTYYLPLESLMKSGVVLRLPSSKRCSHDRINLLKLDKIPHV